MGWCGSFCGAASFLVCVLVGLGVVSGQSGGKCALQSSDSLASLVQNQILEDKVDNYAIKGVGEVRDVNLSSVRLFPFNLTNPAPGVVQLFAPQFRAKIKYTYEVDLGLYTDKGTGNAVARGPLNVTFLGTDTVTCNLTRVRMDISSPKSEQGLLGSIITGIGTELLFKDRIESLTRGAICARVEDSVTGKDLEIPQYDARAAIPGGQSGFHWIMLALGLVVGIALGVLSCAISRWASSPAKRKQQATKTTAADGQPAETNGDHPSPPAAGKEATYASPEPEGEMEASAPPLNSRGARGAGSRV
ncbi:unnamed protein product [Vitrella brassicaformis CCMP3155]|uniref:Uncharacterized protein n=1 Tax=Vitrella brassicaformis (strain CCMP3155) TaxID=1169540 RepID=A0A0G4FKZ2_VITBC|nr:unnamed protein product [Vitrella brassicaformis CCMP3155]|mmetsp:Transcript_10477/g.25355  ORF Transcript_10477/g.25355 Transcript_10477/m.25355 type:complete len:304 (-) Transcript_10477:1780-2691(-)|eukprot:CEM14051.1 unnamed protein product [Vitrella brassicaformis CCMP3155]